MVDLLLMRFILFLLLTFSASHLFSQVNGLVTFEAGREKNERTISIKWAENEESTWMLENKDRLEIMAVSTQLESSSLPVSDLATTSYSFDIPQSPNVELLLAIDNMVAGEALILKDKISGKIIFSTGTTHSNKVLDRKSVV